MKKDVSREVVERAARAMSRVQEGFKARFGEPTSIHMTSDEVRGMFEKMGPDDRLRFVQKVGMDEFLKMVGGGNA